MAYYYIEATSGERFEVELEGSYVLKELAADFAEDQGWPTQDRRGRGQRMVVELVNPNDPNDTKRLDGERSLKEAGIPEGATLRIFPESIAGVDAHARLSALRQDRNEMDALCEREPNIRYEGKPASNPSHYEVTLNYPSFIELAPGESSPRLGETHRVEIVLGADYPRRAPTVRWLTPIFHPNIAPLASGGAVCLGVLKDRYLPGLGLARLVQMLVEILHWRNYDTSEVFNVPAAEWATKPETRADARKEIQRIGGFPPQEPLERLVAERRRQGRTPVAFRPVASEV